MNEGSLSGLLTGSLIFLVLTLLGGHEQDPDDPQGGDASQIRWLRSIGDREALFQIVQHEPQHTQGLQAAEALAELGDVRGLDHLIEILRSSSPYLRKEAASILESLGHPRGLRALQLYLQEADAGADAARADSAREDLSTSSGSGQAALRQDLYNRLDGRATDELVSIWHEDDRSQWSDLAFDVIGDILTERLGQPPPRAANAASVENLGEEEIDEDADPAIQRLWIERDIDGLNRILRDEEDWSLQLEAAEALADLGDQEALDFLIGALDEPHEDAREIAAELLEWLNLPRADAALQAHGIEFESDAEDTARDSVDFQPRSAAPPIQELPAEAESAWAAFRQRQTELAASQTDLMRPATIGRAASAQPTHTLPSTDAQLKSRARATQAGAWGGTVGAVVGFVAKAFYYAYSTGAPYDFSAPAPLVLGSAAALTLLAGIALGALAGGWMASSESETSGAAAVLLPALIEGLLAGMAVGVILPYALFGLFSGG